MAKKRHSRRSKRRKRHHRTTIVNAAANNESKQSNNSTIIDDNDGQSTTTAVSSFNTKNKTQKCGGQSVRPMVRPTRNSSLSVDVQQHLKKTNCSNSFKENVFIEQHLQVFGRLHFESIAVQTASVKSIVVHKLHQSQTLSQMSLCLTASSTSNVFSPSPPYTEERPNTNSSNCCDFDNNRWSSETLVCFHGRRSSSNNSSSNSKCFGRRGALVDHYCHGGGGIGKKYKQGFLKKQSTLEAKKQKTSSSEQSTISTSFGDGNRVIRRIRTLHEKYSSQLVRHLVKVCAWLGLNLKNTTLFKSTSKPENQSSKDEQQPKLQVCQECKHCREEINALKHQVTELNDSLNTLKSQLGNFESLETQIVEIKDIIKKISEPTTPKIPNVPCHAPRPPPPPPPPPPAPPLIIPLNTTNKIQVTRRNVKEPTVIERQSDARPIISVDDILRVKLKKATDRPESGGRRSLGEGQCSSNSLQKPSDTCSLSKLTRCNTQPMISLDMLKKVKLRPANSAQQQSSTNNSPNALSAAQMVKHETRVYH